MDSILIHSPISTKPSNPSHSHSPNLSSILKHSISRILSSLYNNKIQDFSNLNIILPNLLHSSSDPPLESIWLYSVVNFQESNGFLEIKNLIHFFSSFSCNSLKSIALLAPSVSYIYSYVLEWDKISGNDKEGVMKEILSLVDAILSYISVLSGKICDGNVNSENLLCFPDLVKIWTFGRLRNLNESGLDVFFPLVSEEIREKFIMDGVGVEYLSCVVVFEAFFLRLCLKVCESKKSIENLKRELRVWAISSVTVFRSHVFFEILLRMLLDSTLPVISLLDSKDENLLREVLYDVVILVDYSFLNPGTIVNQSYDFMKRIAFRRLIVTHDAIQIASEKGNHGKAISYIGAFSTSCLPYQIIKWVETQIGIEKTKRLDINTPQAVIEWLMGIEDQGLRFFGDNTTSLGAKLRFHKSRAIKEVSVLNTECRQRDIEDEEMQTVDNSTFLTAATSLANTEGRKRKEFGGKEEIPIKFVKYKVDLSLMKDGTSSRSDAVNPPSDYQMEES